MKKIISVQTMQEIAANINDQGDTRYSHKEVRELLKLQETSTLETVGEWLDKQITKQYCYPGYKDVYRLDVFVSDVKAFQAGRKPEGMK